jgi:hypothetical protein
VNGRTLPSPRDDHSWKIDENAQWRRIQELRYNNFQETLYNDYFCTTV